jgi:hypothetical protein
VTTVTNSGEQESERRVRERERARGGREEGSLAIFIERGRERRASVGVINLPSMAFMELEWR